MGTSLSYLAVKNLSREDLLKRLAIATTGDFNGFFETSYDSVDLQNGWYLVIDQEYGSDLFKPEILSQLSANTELVTCMVAEAVMCSDGTGWKDGKKIWSVHHVGDGDDNSTNLTVEGEMPADFERIKKLLFAEQRAGDEDIDDDDEDDDDFDRVDYIFEIPIELFRSICGFRYDMDTEGVAPDEFRPLSTIA